MIRGSDRAMVSEGSIPTLDSPTVTRALERWLEEHAYASYDPYDALTSPLLRPAVRTPFVARVCMQIVKRSPLNLRGLLGIRPAVYTKTLSDLVSTYALRAQHGDSGARERARHFLGLLRERRLAGIPGIAWGMDLPYVSRFAVATPSTPNLFQTVNAAVACLDAWDVEHRDEDLELALGSVEFLERGLGRLEDGAETLAWRYYPDLDARVDNVNALVGALLLRLGRCTERADLADLGRRTLRFVAAGQNADGSWYYAREHSGHWVDGFHTGYVLESFLEAVGGGEVEFATALQRGVNFYLERLFTPAGLPRYTADALFPIEVQNAAEAIQVLAKLSMAGYCTWTRVQEVAGAVIGSLFTWTRRGAEPAGYFVLARGRHVANRLAAVRWGQAPMLLALTHLAIAETAAAKPSTEAG